jgi:hypothetical protein
VPTRIAFDAVGVTALPHFVEGNDAPKITAAQRLDMVRVAVRIGNLTAQDPDGVQLASGGMPPLIGFERNAAYADRQPIASYVDPPLPWPARTGGEPRALALARLFHRAHAADWCEIMSSDYLRGLKYHVTEAASRDPLERATAMEVCTEFVKRHVRGRNDKGAALTDEPLCRLAASAPDSVAVVNTMTSVATPTDESVAQAWCACGNGTLEAGEECDASAPSGDTACPGACRAPNHTRTIGALEVYDDCRCGEVCDDDVDNDGDDDVDCTDDDCKNDPACAPTRIYFSTCSSFARAGQATIRSMNADGSDLKQVGVGGAEVRVSPDGARLASVTSATTVSTSRLDGSDRHDITVQGQIEVFGGLAWSPPGDSIVIAVMGRNREDTAPERQLQTSPDRTGTTDGIWHLGPTLGTRVDWVAGNWLFNYSYNGASGYLNGAASAPAFSESRVAVFNPYSEPVFGLVGNVRYRPDGTPSWSGVLGGTTGLIVDGVLWLGTDAFGIPAYSPDGLWVAAAYTGGIAVFAFDGSSAYNAYFGSSICGLDWGRGVPPVPAGP